ncbi:hypothetical protein PILCRDRAFT_86622 [Piloderma croceum F 1598]|uniref:Uncharacterized protein n=1 Tax=Piloderma croceum (strain F 1598) TaxID=765440 RepID=A0A0C3G740_PILCF|nr:hypothetical protein PILCRDRAFT_86622 [Piloderma croceum F 1598]
MQHKNLLPDCAMLQKTFDSYSHFDTNFCMIQRSQVWQQPVTVLSHGWTPSFQVIQHNNHLAKYGEQLKRLMIYAILVWGPSTSGGRKFLSQVNQSPVLTTSARKGLQQYHFLNLADVSTAMAGTGAGDTTKEVLGAAGTGAEEVPAVTAMGAMVLSSPPMVVRVGDELGLMLMTNEMGEGGAAERLALSASVVQMVSGTSFLKMKVTHVVLKTEDMPGYASENSSTVVCNT